MPAFDLNSIWTSAGGGAAAVIVGLIFGFLQSVIPGIPSTGTVRNWVLAILSAGLVVLAAFASGATPDAGNVFAAFLTFLGVYLAATAASVGGTAVAVRTAGGTAVRKT